MEVGIWSCDTSRAFNPLIRPLWKEAVACLITTFKLH